MNDQHFKAMTLPELPPASQDKHDVLLRNIVTLGPDGLEEATHVVIGCPQDEGVKRNGGRPGAALAPAAIRTFLYKLKPPVSEPDVRICDLGDVPVDSGLEAAHEHLFQVVSQMLNMGRQVLVLGGGNDISLADGRAMHAAFGDFSAMNVDSHLDMRKADIIHSGTPYRNLIESGFLKAEHFHEVGLQPWANAPAYLEDALEMGVSCYSLDDMREEGPKAVFEHIFGAAEATPFFIGLDMDGIRASDAPGVSAPSPVGLSAQDVIDLAALANENPVALFEITETNPTFDHDGRTARLAALVGYTYIFGN